MVSSSFLRGKLLRSVLHLFHQAFVQCVQTGTGALTGLWLRDGVAWLTINWGDFNKILNILNVISSIILLE